MSGKKSRSPASGAERQSKLKHVIKDARLKVVVDGKKNNRVRLLRQISCRSREFSGFVKMKEFALQTIWPTQELTSEIKSTSKAEHVRGKRRTWAQWIGIVKRTKEFRRVCVRTSTNKVLWMGLVPRERDARPQAPYRRKERY